MSRFSQISPDTRSSVDIDQFSLPETPKPRAVRPNPLLKMSIAQRLARGFLIPALVVTVAAGIIGYQGTQFLSRESGFYQHLFHAYTQLTSGESTLQQMESAMEDTFNDAWMPHSHDKLPMDQAIIQNLVNSYNQTLVQYEQNGLLDQHPNEVALFAQGGHTVEPAHQRTLADRVTQTWQTYRTVQEQIVQDLLSGHLIEAQNLHQTQGEPAYGDALSALHTLIQFDGNLVVSVQDATNAQQAILFTINMVAAAFMLLALWINGWLIWRSVVPRLRQLQRIALAVQAGQMETRAEVAGQDEITDVSISVNTMLDKIVRLWQESQHQKDLLLKAAERLFVEMRIERSTSPEALEAMRSDPVGALINAFRFSNGRFRRYLLQTQPMIEQLEVTVQQEMVQVETFHRRIQALLPQVEKASLGSHPLAGSSKGSVKSEMRVQELGHLVEFSQQLLSLTRHLQTVTQDMRAKLALFQQHESESVFEKEASRQSDEIDLEYASY